MPVDVYRGDLDTLPPAWCAARLSAEERAHLDALPDIDRTRRAAASRALVRHVLAAYLDTGPRRVPLLRTRLGKPYLAALRENAAPIHFNAAHSGATWVLAVSADTPLGIDVEVATRERFPDAIGEIVLSVAERAAFAALESHGRASFLASAWVAKEALLKLHGMGLDVAPAQLALAAPLRGATSTWIAMPVARDVNLYGWRGGGAVPVVAAIAAAKPCGEIVEVALEVAA